MFILIKICKYFDIIVNLINDDFFIDFYFDIIFLYWNIFDGGEYIIVFESNIIWENEYGIFVVDDIDIGNNISIGLIDFINDMLLFWEFKKFKRNKIKYNYFGIYNEMILCYYVDKEFSGFVYVEICVYDD